jgi:hypothetical protein
MECCEKSVLLNLTNTILEVKIDAKFVCSDINYLPEQNSTITPIASFVFQFFVRWILPLTLSMHSRVYEESMKNTETDNNNNKNLCNCKFLFTTPHNYDINALLLLPLFRCLTCYNRDENSKKLRR